MLSVDEALRLVLEHSPQLSPAPRAVHNARGFVLAEPIVSDIDSPPFDKSIVDGYAVIAADVQEVGSELDVLEQITAGQMPTRSVERGTATQIMTGAPLPLGADAVVMVEHTQTSGNRVRINQTPVKVGQNIMRRATSLSRGQVVLQPGKVIRAVEMGLLAEVGRSAVSVIPRPRVSIGATGNELVDASAMPSPGQIRNSNERLLGGLISQAGGLAFYLGIARDNLAAIDSQIGPGMWQEVLLITGGVSAGVLDLVPQALKHRGVTEIFHKVNVKPGKPVWFGVKDLCAGHKTLVFGLPGNPVSALVCFELFVRPAIQKLRGVPPTGLRRIKAQLTKEHRQRGDRPTYWPALLSDRQVTPLPWQGSGDLRTLTDANCLAYTPPGEHVFAIGDEVECLLFSTADF
jgi:molybdopterin molybdotransferase